MHYIIKFQTIAILMSRTIENIIMENLLRMNYCESTRRIRRVFRDTTPLLYVDCKAERHVPLTTLL